MPRQTNEVLLALKRAVKFSVILAIGHPAVSWSQPGENRKGLQPRVYGLGSAPIHKWTIVPIPMLDISSDGPVEVSDVMDVARLSNGDVAVGSVGTNDIRFFSRTGKHLLTVGRTGQGPGEFNALVELLRVRDTIVAVDASGIAHVFTGKGAYVRTETRPTVPTGEEASRLGYTSTGLVILRSGPPSASSQPNKAAMQEHKLWMRDGDRASLLGSYPAWEIAPRPTGKPRLPVFGARAYFAVLSSGYCGGYAGRYLVTCYNLKGEPTAQFERRGLTAPPVLQSYKDLYFLDDSLANPTPQHASGRAYVKQTTRFASTLGFFGAMMASANDEVWIGPVNPGDATVRGNASPTVAGTWSVYSAAGEWLSDVALPARFRVMDVGKDFVAGVRTDADDVEHVVVYSIRR